MSGDIDSSFDMELSPPLLSPPSQKVKLHSDSFEETYHSTRNRKSRLTRSSRKKAPSSSTGAWKTWDLSSSKKLRTYSKKSSSDTNDPFFEALVEEKSSKPSLAISSEDEEEELPHTFSPDDGPLFASPIASRLRSEKKESSFLTRRVRKVKHVTITSPLTPKSVKKAENGVTTPKSKIALSNTSTPNAVKPQVILQPLSESLIEEYTKEHVRCNCSSFDKDYVLECDYCPLRFHASCHDVGKEEYDQIIEVGLLWSCPECQEKKKESFLESSIPPREEKAPRIQAKGGKKWRRTMAHNLNKPLASRETIVKEKAMDSALEDRLMEEESTHSPKSIIPTVEESEDVVHKLNDLSLADQNCIQDVSITSIEHETPSPFIDILFCCQQTEVLPFDDLYEVDIFEKSKKVGEGTFGEVYLLNGIDPESEYPPVLKIIPVDGPQLVNNEPQTSLEEVLAEIQISLCLSSLVENEYTANFVLINRCRIVEGNYPEVLLRLWDKYDEEKESLNIRPDYLGSDQKYIAFEFSNGGTDLETTTLYNAVQGLSVFNQVAHALAVAEEALSFEHRDLHWGNILIQGTEDDIIAYTLDEDSTYIVHTSGVKATIIDFSLSRLTIEQEEFDIFKDISNDETLFNADGDYQFEIYRLMREANKNNWKTFNPYTNVLWLHYLLDKLISSVPYKVVKSRAHRSAMSSLRHYKKKIMEYLSAKHYVISDGVPFSEEQ